MIPRRIVPNLVAGLASALLLGACGSSTGAAPAAPASSAPAPAATPATSAASTPATGSPDTTTSVTARTVDGVGIVVTDERGLALYRYDKDQPSPSKWTCSGACTKTWIPVIVQGSVGTAGVEKSLLGTVHRNGRTQLTLAGWPLYRYVGDTAAGQVNGQGKDGAWYAVTPAGKKSAG